MLERWEASVPCRDRADRQRNMTVLVTEDNYVAVIAPPGELGKLTPAQLQALQQALTSAQLEAGHRRGGRP